MFFNGRIIITSYYFQINCRNSQVLTHSDLKMTFSFVVIDSNATTTVKFVKNFRTRERWNFVFKCKNVTHFALSLENKPDIAVRKFTFHDIINSCEYLKRRLT